MDPLVLSGRLGTLSLSPGQQPARLIDLIYSQHEERVQQGLQQNTAHQSHISQLQYVLEKQTEERNSTSFSRGCLFCRKHFTGNRSLLFEHLTVDHNFYLGSLDNIVFANELLDAISQKLESLQCVYCEKTFKDWNVLKEHMRKKFHKRINPKNKKYDAFYVQSYKKRLQEDTSRPAESEFCSTADSDDDHDDLYMECQDENTVRDQECMCLLCPETLQDFEKSLLHMKQVHNFDFMGLKRLHRLDFYKQMKLCNYYRTQIQMNCCPLCHHTFPTHPVLLDHMVSTSHVTQLPDMKHWDQPMYYSVTRDNDNFLCFLDDEYEDTTSMDQPVVHPEDIRLSWDPFLVQYLYQEGLLYK